MKPTDPISELRGVGEKTQFLLSKLDIKTVGDLLNHVPFRYETRDNEKKINELISEESASVICKVESIKNIFTKNGYKLTNAKVSDDTGSIDVTWFNQHYLTKSIKPGTEIVLFGKISKNKAGKTMFNSPQWEYYKPLKGTEKLMPVYPSTDGLPSKFIKNIIQKNINEIEISERYPAEFLSTYKLINIEIAYKNVHTPKLPEEISNGRLRLAFDEMLNIHLKGMKIRKDWELKQKGFNIKVDPKNHENFLKLLSFELTNAQLRSIKEINNDLNSHIPMNRLLQGDVGSGKTVVAASASYHTHIAGYTTIILAPTQILANQHYETLTKIFKSKDIPIHLVTNETEAEKYSSGIIVGTHAILHRLNYIEKVGLIIVDEQHRFGVNQRSILVEHFTEIVHSDLYTTDNINPNLLTMTATPIPRSLALTFYGDLDLSILNEMPKGRKIVQTWVIDESKRDSAYSWIKKQIDEKETQVFIVCPFIEESQVENLKNVKAAEKVYESIANIFKDYNPILLHGKMDNKAKNDILDKFGKKEHKILVTTPVIEVGIDFPNANIMIIETPERFGLASLHQLRGRVGRGKDQGYCVLITGENAQFNSKRLKYMETVHEGHKLAEIDMKLRGPGNIYGKEQHGYMDLKVADITDVDMIKFTKSAALEIYKDIKKYPKIKEYVDNIDYIGDD